MLNYMLKIEQLRLSGVLTMTTGVHQLDIQHDDDCPILLGIPECNCDPDILLRGKKLRVNKYH